MNNSNCITIYTGILKLLFFIKQKTNKQYGKE